MEVKFVANRHKNKKPWHAHLHKLKLRQNRLYRQFLRHPQDPARHAAYKLARNFYPLEVCRACVNKHRQLSCALEARSCRGTYHWWKKAKALCQINHVQSQIPNLCRNDSTAETWEEKVALFSTHCAEQCTSVLV